MGCTLIETDPPYLRWVSAPTFNPFRDDHGA
jgi:hypothetical protein